jgi:hypothetical protein
MMVYKVLKVLQELQVLQVLLAMVVIKEYKVLLVTKDKKEL